MYRFVQTSRIFLLPLFSSLTKARIGQARLNDASMVMRAWKNGRGTTRGMG